MKTKTLFTRNSINRLPLQRPFLLIACAGVLFALSPKTQAQLSPAPDGGYAKMTIVPRAMLPLTAENSDDPTLVTIFSNLASNNRSILPAIAKTRHYWFDFYRADDYNIATL